MVKLPDPARKDALTACRERTPLGETRVEAGKEEEVRGRRRRRLSTALLSPAPETTFLAVPIFACPLCSPVRAFLSFFFPPLFLHQKGISLFFQPGARQSSELLHSKRRGDSNLRSPKGDRSDKKGGKQDKERYFSARQLSSFVETGRNSPCSLAPLGQWAWRRRA